MNMIHSRYSHPQTRKFYEQKISSDNLVLPIFVTENEYEEVPIKTLPGISRFGFKSIIKYLGKQLKVEPLVEKGLKSIIIFGVLSENSLKDDTGQMAFHEQGPTQKAIKEIKKFFNILIITDVCLCGFTKSGHCGILDQNDRIDNNLSIKILAQVALSHAQAGADIVAPSDMMDSRVKSIKNILQENNYSHVSVMSYSAKFQSNFYGPFRDVCNSAPKGDRKCYQLPKDSTELAMQAVQRDIKEGVNFQQRGRFYNDIAVQIKQKFDVITACYHVSGEYSMIYFGDQAGVIIQKQAIDKKSVVMEYMTAFRRAGIDIIITYFVPDILTWLKE